MADREAGEGLVNGLSRLSLALWPGIANLGPVEGFVLEAIQSSLSLSLS